MNDQNDGPEQEAPAVAPRSRLTPESISSALALIIAIFALAVSLFEANTQRVQQRASVWPYIDLDQRYTADGYALEIVNKGIGPARIMTLDVRLDGESITSLESMIIDAIGEENAFSYELYRSSNLAGSVMSPEERDQLFAVPWEARTRLLAEQFNSRGSIEACYCSIFNDCWTVELRDSSPQPVSDCPVD